MYRFFAVFVVIVLVSCATKKLPQGEDFSLQRALYVTTGMEDVEVLRLMEQTPYDRLSASENMETWVWVFSRDGETKTFTVQLDAGKVIATNIRVE